MEPFTITVGVIALWKIIAAGGGLALSGVAGWGVWVGYNESKRQ